MCFAFSEHAPAWSDAHTTTQCSTSAAKRSSLESVGFPGFRVLVYLGRQCRHACSWQQWLLLLYFSCLLFLFFDFRFPRQSICAAPARLLRAFSIGAPGWPLPAAALSPAPRGISRCRRHMPKSANGGTEAVTSAEDTQVAGLLWLVLVELGMGCWTGPTRCPRRA